MHDQPTEQAFAYPVVASRFAGKSHLCTVGGSKQQHAWSGLEAVKLSEELIQGLVPLLIQAQAPPSACNATG